MSEDIVLTTTVIDTVNVDGALYQRSTSYAYKGGRNTDGSPKLTTTYDSVFLGYAADQQ